MGLYETINMGGGLSYIGMWPTIVFVPVMWQMMFLETAEKMTDEVVRSISALFLLLTSVAFGYFFASYIGSVEAIDCTVLQRAFIVGPCILTSLIVGQDPFGDGHLCAVMCCVDFIGGIAQGFSAPGGWTGIIERFWAMWSKTPDSPKKKALRVESYVGFAFGFMCVVHAVVMPPQAHLSVMRALVGCIVPYVSLWHAAHEIGEAGERAMTCGLVGRVVVAALCLGCSEYYGYQALPMRMQIAALLIGAVSSGAAAFVAAASGIYLYYEMTGHIFGVEDGPITWLIFWGVVTWATSEGWVFLFYDSYDEKQKKRVLNTNWQDRILGLFEFAAGAVLAKAGALEPGTVGEAVVYLLPPVTIWFTLETKMLNHMQVGTPFHPTWWVDGDLPKFSPTDYVNVTFGVATALITIILTTYAFYAVTSVVSFSAFSFSEPSIWKFAAAHGITFVFHSGIWMIVASSGVPEVGAQKMFQLFPPPLPPFVRANPHDCIPVHKIDLFIGNSLLFIGGFILSDDLLSDVQEYYFKVFVFLLWGVVTLMKLKVHYDGWGYVDPVSAGKVKKN
uniref:Uncharacterized protein n=1 Tax=Trieres chinensis TaxID=1514140 RepID=A0A7S2A4J5_TRICV|mmetsp:Transcript_39863/g.81382  ORF Transcript_39863/g.81382 Transcript_39863/m.81382 type:complete len:561 (+) Transcript_39863:97-1779(+)|eukprot:CAMPEP_0183310798 /NCGR_PEP_ID=MMETSP0160_2-20130417/33327_1 /TAXON_ID=2839 ORGANISM="Odontella Sinensis, Strain Grunow 1884" /NCGR_SAMPLE_ID=MMETSP0160_2 /ASSEMBLY_ACC=CAM_ASM_000250 /LENGTH=560 /DNA_ID=CAMNT_0025475171 /DNA_START=56 /DNA_END=1738 /DNA_ORIENTATION=-